MGLLGSCGLLCLGCWDVGVVDVVVGVGGFGGGGDDVEGDWRKWV